MNTKKKETSRKDKNVAAIIAFFLGMFGIHRFYLGQTGLGIFYLILSIPLMPLMTVIGIIDAIVLLAMDRDKFNFKYNRAWFKAFQRPEEAPKAAAPIQKEPVERYQRQEQERKEKQRINRKQRAELKRYTTSGIEHFKEYDFKAAIADFSKALAIAPNDTAVHFNIACAYSLSEDAEKAIYHLDKAVANGFDDFGRIRTHDALAYVRIQDAYDAFEENNFRLPTQARTIPVVEVVEAPKGTNTTGNLLEQLKQLGELRERGHLTDSEFMREKERLFA